MGYARTTTVSPERSRAEVEETLRRHGATSFVSGWNKREAMMAFEILERRIRFVLPMPDPKAKEFRYSPTGRERRGDAWQSAYEQAVRSRWRALVLCLKAKLEAVETGITTVEQEFMPFIVLPDGKTVAEHALPAIEEAYETGVFPPLIPPLSLPSPE